MIRTSELELLYSLTFFFRAPYFPFFGHFFYTPSLLKWAGGGLVVIRTTAHDYFKATKFMLLTISLSM